MPKESESLNTANRYFSEKNYEEAIRYYRQAIEFNRLNADYYEYIANSYSLLEKADEAAMYYQWALDIDPTRIHLKNKIIGRENNESSKTVLSKEFSSDDPTPYIHSSQEKALAKKKKEEALKQLEQAKKYYRRDLYSECVNIIKNVLEITPDIDAAYLFLALAYFKLNNIDLAKSCLDKLLSSSKASANEDLMNVISLIYLYSNQLDAHLDWLEEIPNTIGKTAINMAINGTDVNTPNLKLKAICKNGSIKSSSEEKLSILIQACVRREYMPPESFTQKDLNILIFQLAKVLQEYMEPQGKVGEIKFKVSDKKILSDENLKKQIENAIKTGRWLIERRGEEGKGKTQLSQQRRDFLDSLNELHDLTVETFSISVKNQKSVLARIPTDALDHIDRAEAYLVLNQYIEAIAEFEKAISLGNKHYSIYLGLAKAYSNLTRIPESNNAYIKALELDSSCHAAYIGLGDNFKLTGDLSQAIDNYNKAISLHPNNPQYYFTRAEAYNQLGNLPKISDCTSVYLAAKNDYEQALTLQGGVFPAASAKIKELTEILVTRDQALLEQTRTKQPSSFPDRKVASSPVEQAAASNEDNSAAGLLKKPLKSSHSFSFFHRRRSSPDIQRSGSLKEMEKPQTK